MHLNLRDGAPASTTHEQASQLNNTDTLSSKAKQSVNSLLGRDGSSSTTNTTDPTSKTKQNITTFLSRDGQSDTTVHETINPAVQHEHITNTQHDENQKVVDREIHQDHYHLTTQPIRDSATVPTSHSHQVTGVETREVQHGNDQKVKEQLERERAQFRDTRDISSTQHTTSTGPTVAGEHIHHHIHENIQPVINREIHQEHVVHTTHPVHEIHHNESLHHSASVLPEMDINEYQRQGGSLNTRQERTDAFQGPPKSIDDRNKSGNNILGGPGAKGTTSVTGNTSGSSHMSSSNQYTTLETDNVNSAQFSSGGSTSTTGGSAAAVGGLGMGAGAAGGTSAGLAGTSGVESTTAGMKTTKTRRGSNDLGTERKGSIIDKLNPTKDSTGSGNPGFMH